MPYFPKRVDKNQAEIVQALRGAGATVQCLHFVGRGFPDILVGYKGQNFLLEVKDGSKAPSKRKLTPCEQAWHENWHGQVAIVKDPQEAFCACGLPVQLSFEDVLNEERPSIAS